MVSEVVTNAVKYGLPLKDAEDGIALRLEKEEDVVRAVVLDGGKRFEWKGRELEEQQGRWGLSFVDRLADRWGLIMDGVKGVWFEINRDSQEKEHFSRDSLLGHPSPDGASHTAQGED